ncbi:murein hydrolase activator EnvC [Sneathiella sp.]|uniref:murein hydrolase activator EnvC family protein n=1 Tax=Sneathiella sp. TaxID=1964365 RepID=UPI0035684AA7
MLRPELSFLPVHRILRPITVAVFGLLLIGPFQAAAATPDQELTALRDELAASTSRKESFSAQLQNLNSEIKALKQKLVIAARNLTAVDQNLIDVEQRLEEIRQVEDDTLADLSKRNIELAHTLSALINLSRQPEGTLMGNPAGLVDSLRASALLQSILPTLKKNADQLSHQLESLASLREQYATEKETYISLRDQRVTDQEELDSLLATKNTAQEKIAMASKSEQARLEKLTANVQDLTDLIGRLDEEKKRQAALDKERLEQEIARKELEQRQRQQELQAKKAEVPLSSPPVPVPAKPPKAAEQMASVVPFQHFLDAKGTLPLPVGGRIISKFGESSASGQEKGIVIESRADAAVISPFDGEIAFAGPFRHYGLLVIIDHGDGFHTLLAGLGSIVATTGQLLLAGEPVGQMKNSSKEKPRLYMELRNNGAPINPIPWLVATNRKVSG